MQKNETMRVFTAVKRGIGFDLEDNIRVNLYPGTHKYSTAHILKKSKCYIHNEI